MRNSERHEITFSLSDRGPRTLHGAVIRLQASSYPGVARTKISFLLLHRLGEKVRHFESGQLTARRTDLGRCRIVQGQLRHIVEHIAGKLRVIAQSLSEPRLLKTAKIGFLLSLVAH